MEDYQQDAHQKPSTEEPKPLLTFWRLIVFCALLAVAVAVGLHYYVDYSRKRCDRAAYADMSRTDAVMLRLQGEMCDDVATTPPPMDELLDAVVASNALRYVVGPYYSWRGGTRQCRVLLRLVKVKEHWCGPQAVALGGSQPAGESSRYVFLYDRGPDCKRRQIMTGIVDARNGKSQDWNAYPYRESPDSPELCYTESMVVPVQKPVAGRPFELRAPKGVPCYQIPELAYDRHYYSR